MPDYDAIKDMVDAIMDRGIDLTPWEKNFIPSVIGQYKQKGWLSTAQITNIEKIYREKTPDGKREHVPEQLSQSQRATERVRNEGRSERDDDEFGYGVVRRDRLAREKGYDE